MNLHEYQSKALMKLCGLPVPRGYMCTTASEAEAAAEALGGGLCYVKAQVLAGGRGKAGGIRPAKSPEEAEEIARAMLGMRLFTGQTGADGTTVRKVYVEEACEIDRELYLSLHVDRSARKICIAASTEGGMDIEELSRSHPEKIIKVHVSFAGLESSQAAELSGRLELDDSLSGEFEKLVSGLFGMFIKYDLSLVEVNPLVVEKSGEFVALDAKCSVDDNALYRQPCLAKQADLDEIDEKERVAGGFGLNYVALKGNIGCMVNGAGLAMATMDIIRIFGGEPANFLDVGGGASKEMVKEGFKILMSDPHVKAILINIFGGILRCDVLAQGIVDAAGELSMKVPLVVRLEGTNVEPGREILGKSGMKIISAETMADAAEKAVRAAGA